MHPFGSIWPVSGYFYIDRIREKYFLQAPKTKDLHGKVVRMVTEVPASYHEVEYFMRECGAKLIVDQDHLGKAVLVLKSKTLIPVMSADVVVLVRRRGYVRHLIHYSRPLTPQ